MANRNPVYGTIVNGKTLKLTNKGKTLILKSNSYGTGFVNPARMAAKHAQMATNIGRQKFK